jgi:hypothetical protein
MTFEGRTPTIKKGPDAYLLSFKIVIIFSDDLLPFIPYLAIL